MDWRTTAFYAIRLTVSASTALFAFNSAFCAEETNRSPCAEDAIIVFDASGSMSGNQTLGVPNSRARIDEARAALDQVVPNATMVPAHTTNATSNLSSSRRLMRRSPS